MATAIAGAGALGRVDHTKRNTDYFDEEHNFDNSAMYDLDAATRKSSRQHLQIKARDKNKHPKYINQPLEEADSNAIINLKDTGLDLMQNKLQKHPIKRI